MRAIDADALQLAIVEEGQANKRKKYIIGDIWELTGAEIREVINSQPTIQLEIVRCKDCGYRDEFGCCKYWVGLTMGMPTTATDDEDFCSCAKRREVTQCGMMQN